MFRPPPGTVLRHPGDAQGVCFAMRPTNRLGKTIARRRLEHESSSSCLVDSMAGRNVDRLHAVPRPYDAPDDLIPIDQRDPLSLSASGLFGFAQKSSFRTTHRRNIPPHPEVAGQTQSAWMRQSLTIEQNQVGPGLELLERFVEERTFPEGKVSGNVGKSRRPHRRRGFQTRKTRPSHHDDGPKDPPHLLLDRNVAARDGTRPDAQLLDSHALTQIFLRRASVPDRPRPDLFDTRGRAQENDPDPRDGNRPSFRIRR